MKSIRKFHYIIIICAFGYLVMCPAVDHINDAADHDMIKSEVRLQDKGYHKGFAGDLSTALDSSQAGFLRYTTSLASHRLKSSPMASIHLPALSAVRLNL